MTDNAKPTEAMIEAVARALCCVTGANPDAVGLDGNPRWYGWKQFASAAYLAMRSSAPQEPVVDDGELIELLELAGDYAADVFNSFHDKAGPCAIRVEQNLKRFNAARDRLQAKAPDR